MILQYKSVPVQRKVYAYVQNMDIIAPDFYTNTNVHNSNSIPWYYHYNYDYNILTAAATSAIS